MDYKDYKFSEDKDSLCLDGSRVLQVKDSSCLQLQRLTFLPWRVPGCRTAPVCSAWAPGTAGEGLGRLVLMVWECISQHTGFSNSEDRDCNEKQMISPLLELLNS